MAETRDKIICDTIDRLFDENKPLEALQFMLDELKLAKEEGRNNDELLILNELIGYYRQTSQKDELRQVIEASIGLADRMGLGGSVAYATTLVNAANAYRSMGELDKAKDHYLLAVEIYNGKAESGELSSNDMLFAGLFNNLSLLHQELGDYEGAEEYQLKSLAIAEANKAGFEIAVSHANLANTYLLGKKYDKATDYAKKAIELFKARGLKDPHYCAALSALANCELATGNIHKAKSLLEEAIHIVESTIGRNSQYYRLVENLELVKKRIDENTADEKPDDEKLITDEHVNIGLNICRRYYEAYGRMMIHDKFPEYEDRIAVGLVGEGSDCYGFDDEYSRDHDYGPDFCMWLTDEDYEAIGDKLKEEYSKLPKEFEGITRISTTMGSNRRGVRKISEFYSSFIGTDKPEEINYETVPDYALAACTNGQVFRDDAGIFTGIRNELKKGYPANIRLLKLAQDVAGFTQCGQYNYERMRKRDNKLTASIMLADFCRHAMKLYHHIMNVYPPHDKWLASSTWGIEGGVSIVAIIDVILKMDKEGADAESVTASINQIAKHFVEIMYNCGDVSDIDEYLDHHIEELMYKAGIVMLSHGQLVDKTARLEFEAFDKVQNEGGRASCQNNWPTFAVMRKSQYLTWSHEMLVQYLYDFTREYEKGHNLITEKYGRMMASTAPERYEEIKENFPELSEEKKNIIEQIVGIQMNMVEAFAAEHPKVAGNARDLHTTDDNMFNTSYETYLRGEISTYSDKMLQLYGQFVVGVARDGGNIARMTIENTAKLYGYKTLEEFETR